jgi:hypothetical protein
LERNLEQIINTKAEKLRGELKNVLAKAEAYEKVNETVERIKYQLRKKT